MSCKDNSSDLSLTSLEIHIKLKQEIMSCYLYAPLLSKDMFDGIFVKQHIIYDGYFQMLKLTKLFW